MFWKKEKWKISDVKKIDYENFFKHREYLIREKHNMADKEWRLLIYLSSWLLSFSVFILKENFFNEYYYFLIISWILAISSLILVLFSFYFWKKSFEIEIENEDITFINEKNLNKNNYIKVENKDFSYKKEVINSINYARFFLIFGIITLFIFYTLTLLKNVW